LLAVLMVPLAVFGAGACSGSGGAPAPKAIMDKATPFGDLLVPKLSASVTDGAVGVAVDSPVTVNADDGVLASVEMVNENGGTVDGQLSPDGVHWATTERLGYNRMYTLTAKARGLGGVATRQLTFQTHSPHNLTMPYAMPHDGEVVGVGEPVAIQFDEAIANREAAEKAIVVTTDPPVEGAFYWLNKREVRWRPEHFWKPGTNVNIAVNTYGVDLGDGVFGEDNVRSHFTVGDEVIATADDNTKMVTVRVNGVPANSPNGYRTEVDFATQMSYSGVFVHSAPWSVGAQGHTNTSHGCLNVSPSNAQWFFEHTKRGDIVQVVNTIGPTLSGTEGLGDWNIPWDQWHAGNAKA
jgi:lipoprotein-anchoring transpeptidase ErfK/SrfK